MKNNLLTLVLCACLPLAGGIAHSAPVADAGLQAFQAGDFESAQRIWHKQSELASKAGDPLLLSDALVREAEAYRALGQHLQCIILLNKAKSLIEQTKDDYRHAAILSSLGTAYTHVGRSGDAKRALYSAIRKAKKIPTATDLLASTQLNYGSLLAKEKRNISALEAFEDAIQSAKKIPNYSTLSKAHSNTARLHVDSGNYNESLIQLGLARKYTDKLPASHEKAYTYINIANLYRDIAYSNNSDKYLVSSLDHLSLAEKTARKINSDRALSYALGYMGNLYERQQRFNEAESLTSQAIFAAQVNSASEILYRWYWQAGRILKATGDIDGSIAAYRQAVEELQKIRQDLTLSIGYNNKRSSFRDILGPVYLELTDLLLQRSQDAKSDNSAYLIEARQTIENFKSAELQDYFQDDCVIALQSKKTDLGSVDNKTAIFYPILLKDRTEIIIDLPGNIRQVTVPVGSAKITSEVRALRRGLVSFGSDDYLAHSQQLYDWLIRPVEADLKAAKIDTLVFVPDGSLRTIPVSVLHNGKNHLVRDYAIGTTPGLTLTDPRPLNRDKIQLLISGLTESVQGFSALPNVEQEIDNISDIYESKILLDQTYQLKAVENELSEKPYRIVHLASHGQFKSDPKETFILTYDNKMTMDRLENFLAVSKFRDEPIELLTLSACSTAEGDDRAALGLAGVAVKAGARSVLASLWLINDQATAELISEFYTQLKNPANSKAQALRLAQLKLIDQENAVRHPGYWAPFLMIGSWL